MADQNFNPMQPQYIDPQAQPATPYAAAPQPTYGAPAAEPEVILQEVGFADFGFGEEDSVGGGHDFGGFMDDDNTQSDTLDGFNAFNSQTPNLDIAEVEAASTAATAEEKAMFTSTIASLDLDAVEAAGHSDEDRDIFSSSLAVGEREQTMSDMPAFDAAAASFSKPEPELAPAAPTPIFDAPAPAFEVPAPAPVAEPAPAPAPVFEAPVAEPTPAPVVEAAPAAAPTSSFMASMQSMFS